MPIEDPEQKNKDMNSTTTKDFVSPETGIKTDAVDSFKCRECGATLNVEGVPPFSNVNCHACGAKATVPARLNNFLLLKLLGTGGMGGVYYARDEELGRFVAIKVMLQSLGEDPTFIETFKREAQAVAKLNHPNIAQIYSFGQEKGQPYIVMELVSGERVDKMMEEPEGMSPLLAMRIGLEVAQGLSAADEAGLVHGDIKPENILLDTKGSAKLVDFGLATVAHQAAGEGIWGTPYYIAPEKIRRQKVDARSDIYSLGATLYHMLTGSPPFEGDTPVEVVKARLEIPPPDPRELMPDLPELISEIILRMLAVERHERYPNYLSLVSDLKKAVQELGSQPEKTGKLGAGKHIRIKKKRPDAGTSDLTAADGSNSGPKSKRLVIHKGQSASSAKFKTNRNQTSMRSSTDNSKTEPQNNAKLELTAEEIEERRLKRIRKKRKTLITRLVILLLVAGSGLVTLAYFWRQSELEKRSQLFALHSARQKAADMLPSITGRSNRIARWQERAEPFAEEIQSAVELLTGERITLVELEPEQEAEPTPATNGDETTNTTEETEAAVTDTAQAEAVDAEPGHPIVARAREALETLADINILSEKAKALLEKAQALRESIDRHAIVARATADTQKLQAIHEQMEQMTDEAERRFDSAVSSRRRILDIRERHERELAAQQAAEDAAEHRRLEAERKEREKREYEARSLREVEQATTAREQVRYFVDTHNFKEALEQLEAQRENYTTEAGQAAIDVAIDRYDYLVRMKSSLIAAIQETPFPWGWGYGSSARDIENADEKGIYIKGTSTPRAWSSIPVPQMLKLVDFYIEKRTLRASTRIDIAFGGAVYCDMFGSQARDKARQYANRARDFGLQRETFSRLLESGW